MARRKHNWERSEYSKYDYVCLNCSEKRMITDGRAKFETECIPPKVFEHGRGVTGLKWKDEATKDQAEALVRSISEESKDGKE